MYYVMIFTV